MNPSAAGLYFRSACTAIVVLVGAGATGCAHHFNIPANRLDSPEALGRFGAMQAEVVGLQTGDQLTIDPSLTDPGQASSTLGTFQVNYALGFGIGLTPKLDAGIRLQPNGPLLLRFKYQFFGKTEGQSAPGDLSAAVVGSGGLTFVSENGPEASGTTVDLSATYFSYGGHLVLGGKLTRQTLLYLGAGLAAFGYSGTIQESAPPSRSRAFSGNATQPGFFVGLRTTAEAVFIGAELSKTFVRSGTENHTGFFPGLVLGLTL